MKQKRKVKSLIPPRMNWKGTLLTTLLLILSLILCVGSASLLASSVWAQEPECTTDTEIQYPGLDDRVEVLYRLEFAAKNALNTVKNVFSVVGNVLYLTGGSVITERNSINGGENNNILGGDSNSLDSDNVTLIGGYENKVNNDNAALLGGDGNKILGSSEGAPAVIAGGSANEINNNKGGDVILGGESNEIGDSKGSVILGGEDNEIQGGENVIIGGKKVRVGSSLKNIFAFSNDDSGFYPGTSNAFYLNTTEGVGINVDAVKKGLSVKGAIGFGKIDIHSENCDNSNIGVVGSWEVDSDTRCLVGCTEQSSKISSWELLDHGQICEDACNNSNSNGCSSLGNDDNALEFFNTGFCTNHLNTTNARRCTSGEENSYENVVFETKLIDSTEPCPTTTDNKCVYKCEEEAHLTGDVAGKTNLIMCYKDCVLPWKSSTGADIKIKHNETVTAYNDGEVSCSNDDYVFPLDTSIINVPINNYYYKNSNNKALLGNTNRHGRSPETCTNFDHQKTLVCSGGTLYIANTDGKTATTTNAVENGYIYSGCMLNQYRCDTGVYDLTFRDINHVNVYNDEPNPTGSYDRRRFPDRGIATGHRGHYEICLDYNPDSPTKNGNSCSVTGYHYKFLGCNKGYTQVDDYGVKCRKQCKLKGANGELIPYDHATIHTGYELPGADCPNKCEGRTLVCNDGIWKFDSLTGDNATGYSFDNCTLRSKTCYTNSKITSEIREQYHGVSIYGDCVPYVPNGNFECIPQDTGYTLIGCETGYHTESRDPINRTYCVRDEEYANCRTGSIENAVYNVRPVKIVWTGKIANGVWKDATWEYGEWTKPVMCAWNCSTGFHLCGNDNQCCSDTKQVLCDSDPDKLGPNEMYTDKNKEVSVEWDKIAGEYSKPELCPRNCEPGYCGRPNCSDKEYVTCTESGKPDHSHYVNTGEQRSVECNSSFACKWDCDSSYHETLDKGYYVCESNSKNVKCEQTGAPENAEYFGTDEEYPVSWDENSEEWNKVNCPWSCKAGYHTGSDSNGNEICEPNVCSGTVAVGDGVLTGSQKPDENFKEWKYVTGSSIGDLKACEWTCAGGYESDGTGCKKIEGVKSCSGTMLDPEADTSLVVQGLGTYTGDAVKSWMYTGSKTPGECEWTCKDDYHKDPAVNKCVSNYDTGKCIDQEIENSNPVYKDVSIKWIPDGDGIGGNWSDVEEYCDFECHDGYAKSEDSCEPYVCFGDEPEGDGVVTGNGVLFGSQSWQYVGLVLQGPMNKCQWYCEPGYKPNNDNVNFATGCVLETGNKACEGFRPIDDGIVFKFGTYTYIQLNGESKSWNYVDKSYDDLDECEYTCSTGYHHEYGDKGDDICVDDIKYVQCITGENIDDNGEWEFSVIKMRWSGSAQDFIQWDDELNRWDPNMSLDCKWSCHPGSHKEEDGKCHPNTKNVTCITGSDIPDSLNREYDVVEYTNIWDSKTLTWPDIKECNTKCITGYHEIEGGLCVSNSTTGYCVTGIIDSPVSSEDENAEWITGVVVTGYWNLSTQVYDFPLCDLRCKSNFHLEDGKCVDNKRVVRCEEVGGVEHSEYVRVQTGIEWLGEWNEGSWSATGPCPWKCKTGTLMTGNDMDGYKCLGICVGTEPVGEGVIKIKYSGVLPQSFVKWSYTGTELINPTRPCLWTCKSNYYVNPEALDDKQGSEPETITGCLLKPGTYECIGGEELSEGIIKGTGSYTSTQDESRRWTYTGSKTPGVCEWTCDDDYDHSKDGEVDICSLKLHACGTGSRNPEGKANVWTGAAQYTGSYTPTNWTYATGKNRTDLQACEWSCVDGFTNDGQGGCRSYECTGSINSGNAKFLENSDLGLTGDTRRGLYSGVDYASGHKCAYICNSDFEVKNGKCDYIVHDCGTGNGDPRGKAYVWTGAAQYTGLTDHTSWTYVYNIKKDNLNACEWTCDDFSTRVDGKVECRPYECTNLDSINTEYAKQLPFSNLSLTGDTEWRLYSGVDYASGHKCAYYCNPGYEVVDGKCVPKDNACTGNVLPNCSVGGVICGSGTYQLPYTQTQWKYATGKNRTDLQACEWSCDQFYTGNVSLTGCRAYECTHLNYINTGNAYVLTGSTNSLSQDTNWALYEKESDANGKKCAYVCISEYHLSGNACVPDIKFEDCEQEYAPANASYITGKLVYHWLNGKWVLNTGHLIIGNEDKYFIGMNGKYCPWECNYNYDLDGNNCKPKTQTGTCSSSEMPDHSHWVNGDEFRQTWSGSLNAFSPSSMRWTFDYQSNAECVIDCDTGHHIIDGIECKSNTQTGMCTGPLPSYSYWVNSGFKQTWDASQNKYLPETSPLTCVKTTSTTTGCSFICDDTHTCNSAGTGCRLIENGECSFEKWECKSGNPVNTGSNGTEFTWDCQGLDSKVSCTASCPDGQTMQNGECVFPTNECNCFGENKEYGEICVSYKTCSNEPEELECLEDGNRGRWNYVKQDYDHATLGEEHPMQGCTCNCFSTIINVGDQCTSYDKCSSERLLSTCSIVGNISKLVGPKGSYKYPNSNCSHNPPSGGGSSGGPSSNPGETRPDAPNDERPTKVDCCTPAVNQCANGCYLDSPHNIRMSPAIWYCQSTQDGYAQYYFPDQCIDWDYTAPTMPGGSSAKPDDCNQDSFNRCVNTTVTVEIGELIDKYPNHAADEFGNTTATLYQYPERVCEYHSEDNFCLEKYGDCYCVKGGCQDACWTEKPAWDN